MDLDSVIVPGAQSLVTAMLTDAWSSARALVARRWGRSGEHPADVELRLEQAKEQSLTLAGSDGDRQGRLEAYWAGYLAGLLAERPELVGAVRELASGGLSEATTQNSNTGTVHGHLLQARDINGGVHF